MTLPIEHSALNDALQGLRRGDFSLLDSLVRCDGDKPSQLVEWIEEGQFQGHDQELAEALTCACFNGRVEVARYLLERGIAPSGGAGTGMNAIHWAANRGQIEAVRLLIQHKVPLETRSIYGGTALESAVWAAINEPRPDHVAIIKELLAAGARVQEASYPTGRTDIDVLLRSHGAC